jgi:hypothetical protein
MMNASSPDPRRSEPAGTSPLPLAIAVLGLEPDLDVDARRLARVDLALAAQAMGYFVLDIIEVVPGEGLSGYAWVETLARRTDAEALIISGPVDLRALETIADENRMVLRPERCGT